MDYSLDYNNLTAAELDEVLMTGEENDNDQEEE